MEEISWFAICIILSYYYIIFYTLTYNYQICHGDNLIVNKIETILKIGIALFK